MSVMNESKESLAMPSPSLSSSLSSSIVRDDDTFVFEEVEVEIDANADDDALLTQLLPALSDDDTDDVTDVDDDRLVTAFIAALHRQRQAASDIGKQTLPPVSGASKRPRSQSQGQAQSFDTYDYIATLLHRAGLYQSLKVLEQEWRDTAGDMGTVHSDSGMFSLYPDIQLNEHYHVRILALEEDAKTKNQLILELKTRNLNVLHERDFHRLHHRRIIQEKKILLKDLHRLQKHFASYDPLITKMKKEIERGAKEKTMMKIEREKMREKLQKLEDELADARDAKDVHSPNGRGGKKRVIDSAADGKSNTKKPAKGKADSPASDSGSGGGGSGGKSGLMVGGRTESLAGSWPLHSAQNPYASQSITANAFANSQSQPQYHYTNTRTFTGHQGPVTSLSYHPTKNLLCSASEDSMWKLWGMPKCELVMTGAGHTNYINTVKFHPTGSVISSASGDCSVRLWSLSLASCLGSVGRGGDSNVVWDSDWHHSGDYLSLAHSNSTVTIVDCHSLSVMATLRGHGDSVNKCQFLPHHSTLLSASADHTISLWDTRAALAQTSFASHTNSVLNFDINNDGQSFVSVGADSVVNVWDVRQRKVMVSLSLVDGGAVYDVSINQLSKALVTGSEDGTVRIHSLVSDSDSDSGLSLMTVRQLRGHDGAVNCVEWDPSGNAIVSGGADCTFRIWS